MKKVHFMIILSIFVLSLTACDSANKVADNVKTAIEAQGREYENLITAEVGETTTNVFFEWTISSVVCTYDIAGYIPPDGYMYIVADIITTNISYYNNLPMGSYDYVIAWGVGDEEWDYSLYEFVDGMYPDETTCVVGETIEGMLIFLVPDNAESISIIYEEIYDDEFVGNTYSYDINIADIPVEDINAIDKSESL